MFGKEIFNGLFVFEMANNHMGSVEHGLRIIREIHEVCRGFPFRFGFKFQFRDLDTFIHPDYKKRMEFKYVKRFSETRLDPPQFEILKNEIDRLGFISVCTPFDEKSVDLIEKMNFNIIKIASCSFTDWPLLERIAKTNKPIVASTAGAKLEDIDKVVSFFKHRDKNFALMHCVAEYPTQKEHLQLNQIDLLKSRYLGVPIGYSGHEEPENYEAIKIAIAKGAVLFERHVGVETEKIKLNAYSSNPQQIRKWLEVAREAFMICGEVEGRLAATPREMEDLRALARGVFARRKINKGERIALSDIFLAIPTFEGQIIANELSKYTEFYAQEDIDSAQPVLHSQVKVVDNREKIYAIVQKVKEVLKAGNIVVPGMLELEISHHYGVDRFNEYGCTIITVINREYCKKLIVLLPGQKHPEQYHEKKEETFHILYGDVLLSLDGVERRCQAGDLVTVEKGKRHAFSSQGGAVIEEISSTHYKEDSFYTDPEINKNPHRKTLISYWMD